MKPINELTDEDFAQFADLMPAIGDVWEPTEEAVNRRTLAGCVNLLNDPPGNTDYAYRIQWGDEILDMAQAKAIFELPHFPRRRRFMPADPFANDNGGPSGGDDYKPGEWTVGIEYDGEAAWSVVVIEPGRCKRYGPYDSEAKAKKIEADHLKRLGADLD